jgi:hypothetical protein
MWLNEWSRHWLGRRATGRRAEPPSVRLRLELLEDRSVPSAVPIDVVGHLPAAEYNQFITNAQVNFYKDWGNEPYVAVNPLDPSQIVVSSFAYNTPRASLWYSADGGADWNIRFPIPNSPAPGQGVPNDQTFAYDSNGVLHGALLTYSFSKNGPSLNIFHGSTSDPASDGQAGKPDDWQWNTQRVNLPNSTQNKADQPWIAVSGDHVYVAYGDGGDDQNSAQSRVSASSDGGATFTQDNPISKRSQWAAYDPGIRLAADQAGRVYAFFEIGEGPLKSGQPLMTHYRLNVSFDEGATWAYTDSSAEGGTPVADGLSLQAGVSFGGVDFLQSITAIAADPTGAHVYVTYGMEDATGADRIYLAEFHPNATGNLVERANPVALSIAGQRSALPSVAVTANGSIAVQYDTFTDADGQFHVHLATSTDQGQTFTDQDLNDFTAAGIPFPFSRNRLLGDYQGLIAVGNTVFGTFAARGNVQIPREGIDTTDKIDPFVYSVTLPGASRTSLAPSMPSGPTGGAAMGVLGGSIEISFGSTATVGNSALSDNQALGGAGGAGADGGAGGGGAISVGNLALIGFADISSITISGSTLSYNLAQGGAGGSGGNGGDGSGGVYVASGTACINHTSITGNQAVGGAAGKHGSAGQGIGGGLYIAALGTAGGVDTAITDNSASTSNDDVFGVFNPSC